MFDTAGVYSTDGFRGPPTGSQQILNSDWPMYPENFVERPPIPAWVRVEWDRDGEQWCPGVADRWNRWFVHVRFDKEPRAIQGLTWVRPHDVRQRDAGTSDTTSTSRQAEDAAPPPRRHETSGR
jgi:hypothetical protein